MAVAGAVVVDGKDGFAEFDGPAHGVHGAESFSQATTITLSTMAIWSRAHYESRRIVLLCFELMIHCGNIQS